MAINCRRKSSLIALESSNGKSNARKDKDEVTGKGKGFFSIHSGVLMIQLLPTTISRTLDLS